MFLGEWNYFFTGRTSCSSLLFTYHLLLLLISIAVLIFLPLGILVRFIFRFFFCHDDLFLISDGHMYDLLSRFDLLCIVLILTLDVCIHVCDYTSIILSIYSLF